MTPCWRRTRRRSRRAAPSPTCGWRSPGAASTSSTRSTSSCGPGEVVGLVGESGSGKTTAGTALLAYARRGAFIERGTVMFEGQDVLALPWEQIREIRGMKIAYVPQDPGAALNPAIRIGRQIVELLELHDIGTAEERLEGARAGLREVGLPDDDEFLARYPHQLSGGQVQRVALAMAFLPRPEGARAGRADHGPGRHHPGHGAADDGRAVPQPPGRGALRHPRPGRRRQHRRPGRRHVRGADHRARPAGRDVPAARAPVHPRAARRDPAPVPGARAHRHPGLDAGAGAAPDRLPVQHPLRVRPGPLPRDRAGGPPGRPGPHGEVPAGRRDRHLGHQPRQHQRHRPAHRAGHHPDDRRPQGLLRPHGGRARRLVRRGQGRGGRAGRRVRQRQDHDLALRRRPAQAVDRRGDVRGRQLGKGARARSSRTASGSSTSSRTRTCR